MLPLLLGLGLLAGNDWYQQHVRDARAADLTEQYKGLLGTAPGNMGPPDEAGNMGHTSGTGLLADPTNMQNQLQFAAGVAGLRGQQSAGLNLLNAAMSRAQQAQESDRSSQQWERSFGRSGEQFEKTFGAGRDDAAAAAARYAQQFAQQEAERRQRHAEWNADFGLKQDAGLLAQRSEDFRERPQGAEAPRLSPGWTYQQGPAGVIAAPIPGTTDYATGVAKAESLQSSEARVSQMLDLIEGKEQTTANGKKVRLGGMGSEAWGQNAAKYSLLRGQILSDLGNQRQMGVIDDKEYDRLNQQLPDPSSFTSYVSRNSTLGAGYEELKKQIADRREQHFRANPWLIPAVPKGFEPVPTRH